MTNIQTGSIEPLKTIKQAADSLGVPVSAMRRSARQGIFPVYSFNGRIRVRLSEIVSAIEEAQNV